MGLFGRKKKKKEDSNSEWTSFEFVQHIIKHPDTSDDTFAMMYENLLGEDNLEKDMDDYWKHRVTESFISQEEIKKIKKAYNQRFKKIRKLAQAKIETDDIVKWAVTDTDDDRTTNEQNSKENKF